MPSVTATQARTMAMADRDPSFAGRMGIPHSVAHEFHEADMQGHNPKAKALHHIKGVAHGALMDRMKRKRAEIDAISPAHQQEAEADEGAEDEMMRKLVLSNRG